MTKFLLALHIVFAIFAVGPLAHAAKIASRAIRRRDAAAIASTSRMLRVYAITSVLVVGVGLWLMSRPATADEGWYSYTSHPRRYVDYLPPDAHLASFSETWIWLSLTLWAISIALTFAVLIPTLKRAADVINAGNATKALTARAAVTGVIIGASFAAIAFLMVYRPGG